MAEDKSYVKLGLRVKKSKLYPHGWQEITQIPPDEPCVLALGGIGTNDSKKANGFTKMIISILKNKKIPVYGVEYNLSGRNFRIDREAVLARYGQEDYRFPFINYVKEEDKTYIPQYIRQLYAATIAPRLRDENGNRISIQKAAQRLNMLVFANHCQGATVMQQMEHLMQEDLITLGYPKNFHEYLYRQIHSVNVAPVSPIGVTKTTCFKFCSAADEKVTSVCTKQTEYILDRRSEHNAFLAELKKKASERKQWYKPLIMNFLMLNPTKNETIFAVNNMYPLEIQQNKELEGIEHAFDTYSDKDDDYRTKQGDQLSFCFRDILNWLVEHAKKNKDSLVELPNIAKVPALSSYIQRATNNRLDFMEREIALIRQRKQEK